MGLRYEPTGSKLPGEKYVHRLSPRLLSCYTLSKLLKNVIKNYLRRKQDSEKETLLIYW